LKIKSVVGFGVDMPKHTRRLTNTDLEVAKRVRSLRHRASLSQEQVAEALGITFQQVQKYEKGMNRISPGRLAALAALFNVPVALFFGQDHRGVAVAVDTQLDTAVRHQIVSALNQIESPELENLMRDALVVIAKLLA
jgi:transcriptional regulator with XRE-family HTH domain